MERKSVPSVPLVIQTPARATGMGLLGSSVLIAISITAGFFAGQYYAGELAAIDHEKLAASIEVDKRSLSTKLTAAESQTKDFQQRLVQSGQDRQRLDSEVKRLNAQITELQQLLQNRNAIASNGPGPTVMSPTPVVVTPMASSPVETPVDATSSSAQKLGALADGNISKVGIRRSASGAIVIESSKP